jgi:putative endonuclease
MRGMTVISMKYYVYILECKDKSLYVGCTNNIKKRVKQHNESKYGAHYTKIRRPATLLYSEVFKILKDARKREAEIKRWRREKKLDLVNNSNFIEVQPHKHVTYLRA